MDLIVDIKNFPLLETTIDKNIFKSIRLLCVFGCNAAEVIFVTNDDKVYSFGRNRFGGLGLGTDEENIETPRENLFLSSQQVISIFCGFEHWIALTRNGHCYAWGHNEFGQLGVGESVESSNSPIFISDLTNNKVVEICCGAAHTLALTSDGRVYGWGDNQYGQLGDGSSQNRWNPRIVLFDEEVVLVSCGRNHSMALSVTGKVYVWGLNSYGQLGYSVSNKRHISSRPQLITDFESFSFSKVICGPNYSLLLSSDGYVYSFGDNTCGQIGNGTTDSQWTPFKVSEEIQFKDIVAHKENDISIAVSMDDKFYVWGLAKNRRYLLPKEIPDSIEKSIFDVYAIYAKKNVTFKTIVINNEIKSWERSYKTGLDYEDFSEVEVNRRMQKISISSSIDDINDCINSDENNTNDWQQINRSKAKKPKVTRINLDKVMDIKCFLKNPKIIEDSMIRKIRLIRVFGLYGSKVIFATNDDKVYAFGHNRDLSLGLGISEEHILKPEFIRELCGQQLVDIATGYEHCIALTASGHCFGWGQNSFGQLGIGTITPSNKPKPIKELIDTKVVQISCGSYHSLALTIDGELFSWGHNTFAQLGDRTYNSRETPTQVMIPEPIKYITCGLNHSVALTLSGLVYIWGGNEKGQLGRPPEMDVRQSREKPMSNRPHVIKQFETSVITKAVCGSNHTLLLSNKGTIYAFGDNSCGQVGNGTTVDQYLPIKLNKEMEFKDIISHFDNDMSIAVTKDDNCFIWGFVQNKNVLFPTEISNPSGKSLFNIYAKFAKHKVTFKTVVVEEDVLKYVIPPKIKDTNKEVSKQYHSMLKTDPSISYSQITASNDRKPSTDSEDNSKELKASIIANTKSIWDLKEEEEEEVINSLHESEEDITITSNLETNFENQKEFIKCEDFIANVQNTVPEEPKHLNCSEDVIIDKEEEEEELKICGKAFLKHLRYSYNNPNVWDLKIVSGNKVLFCHKTILEIRNNKFWQICSNQMNDTNDVLLINPNSYHSFNAFLQFLYAIEPQIDVPFVEELQSMARFFCEPLLQELCAQVIQKSQNTIDLSNVCTLYEKAINNGTTDLEKKCIEFAANNWKSVLKSEAFESMPDSLSKRLVISVINI